MKPSRRLRSDNRARQLRAWLATLRLALALAGAGAWAGAGLWVDGGAWAAEADINREESRLKLAMMYNFSNFIEWPAAVLPRPDSPFHVCIMGGDPFGPLLQALGRRSYQGHPIVIGHPATVEAARKCHILYVDNPAATALGRDVGRALGGASVLTVSSGPDALEAGVAIGFVLRNDKLRWNMNLNALRQGQLKASAKLIEIAVSVVGEGGK